jgi:hypothetical protein
MEIKETSQSQLPLCKIKYGTWKDFESIGNLPKTFYDFIKIVSSLVFPYNFSIYYLSQDYEMISIASSTTYKNLVNFVQREKNLKEVKIFIFLHEDENKRDIDIISQNSSKTHKSCLKSENNGSYVKNKNGSDYSDENEDKISPHKFKREGRTKFSRKNHRGVDSICIQCY